MKVTDLTTIFLADGEKNIREALSLILAHRADFVVVGEASTTESLLAQVCQNPPEAILLDWSLPGFHPQRLLTALRQCCPETIIMVTSVQPEQENLAVKFGFDGFLLKQLLPDEFLDSLKTAIHVNSNPLRK
ncbi:MAG: response regulator transcription factor [Anaerolineales bacterium]|nr:MAG: response regulator transcription factor [Anaerolineales bacterium]